MDLYITGGSNFTPTYLYKELYMKLLLTMVGALALPVFAADLDTADMTGVSFWLAGNSCNVSCHCFLLSRKRQSSW